ncbi:MAG: GNAT family N-acetyltransferase [Caldilinea sp.]|nr:GNAT family N-acetyltransferase [Caldilinea sp.]MDW8439510.1 GNAT family N-acetyltransferase [Caldilineaceae bacterium]
MKLVSYEAVDAFLAATESELLREEVKHGLLLGLALRLKHHPERFEHRPYLATVHLEEALVAAALMTPPRGLVVAAREGGDVSAAMELLARELLVNRGPAPTVNGVASVARAFAAAWRRLGGDAEVIMRLRVYELRVVIPPAPTPGRLRQASFGDLDCVYQWYLEFHDEATPADPPPRKEQIATSIEDGSVYLWEMDGKPVSLAAKGRNLPHGTSIGPVYTPPHLRGRGYASACVAALSQRILDEGKAFCTLFTDLANPTSNHIYQQIGYRPVCDFAQYALKAPRTAAWRED